MAEKRMTEAEIDQMIELLTRLGTLERDEDERNAMRVIVVALRQVREDLRLSREHHDATLDDLDAAREDAKNYAYNLDQFRAEADRVRAGAEAVLRGLASGADADEAREERDIYQAEVAALQEALEDRERYWDSVRRLMIEAGAEPGDAEHMARSLIGQRDAAKEQVRKLREALDGLLGCLGWYSEQDVIEETTSWLWDSEATEETLPVYLAARAALAAGKKGGEVGGRKQS